MQGHRGIKKRSAMVNSEAKVVMDSVSKAALLDLVADMLRADAGNEELDGIYLAQAFCERFEPVGRRRGDRLPTVALIDRMKERIRKSDEQRAKYTEEFRKKAEQKSLSTGQTEK